MQKLIKTCPKARLTSCRPAAAITQDALAAFWAMRGQPGAVSDYLQPPLLAELLQQVSRAGRAVDLLRMLRCLETDEQQLPPEALAPVSACWRAAWEMPGCGVFHVQVCSGPMCNILGILARPKSSVGLGLMLRLGRTLIEALPLAGWHHIPGGWHKTMLLTTDLRMLAGGRRGPQLSDGVAGRDLHTRAVEGVQAQSGVNRCTRSPHSTPWRQQFYVCSHGCCVASGTCCCAACAWLPGFLH